MSDNNCLNESDKIINNQKDTNYSLEDILKVKNELTNAKVISSMENYQIIDLIKEAKKLNVNTLNNEEEAFGLSLSSLDSNNLVKMMSSYDNLRIDFFKFQLYLLDTISYITIQEVLKHISINTACFEEFIDYLFTNNNENNLILIYNCLIINKNNFLFENQLVIAIKYIICNEYSSSFNNLLNSKNNKYINDNYSSFDSYIEFVKLYYNVDSILSISEKLNLSMFKLYVLYMLIINNNQYIINYEHFTKSLLIEFKCVADNDKNKHEDTKDIYNYDFKAYINLFYSLLTIIDIEAKINNSKNSKSIVSIINCLIDCFILFFKRNYCSVDFINYLHDILNKHDGYNNILDEMQNEDKLTIKLKAYISSYEPICFTNRIINKLNNDNKYCITEDIEI